MEDEIDAQPRRLGVLGGDGLWSVAEVLVASGVTVADLEPAPKQVAEAVARKWHYGRASVRAGLLGHPRAILQLYQQVAGARPKCWHLVDQGLARDAFRPEVDPEPMPPEAVETLRLAHLASLARLPHEVDRLILPLCTDRALVDGQGQVRHLVDDLSEKRFTIHEMRHDLQALHEVLTQMNPSLRLQIAILPSLSDAPDPEARELALRGLIGTPGVLHDAVFDALVLRRMQGGDGATVLARLAQGLALDDAAPATPEAPVDDRARRKERKEKRKAKGGNAKVVCEDELLEAFAK